MSRTLLNYKRALIYELGEAYAKGLFPNDDLGKI